uniref:Uncharacterized protein n=1 Tax=uncultured prokaryote TaxID=198431 RepID=A0A0H5QNT1_9ZZZZ|nr:hypothetical protein [uncultured prokaryote]
MPDRISQYRQVRLTINAAPGFPAYDWRFSATEYRKGVPNVVLVDTANFDEPLWLPTPEAGVTAAVRAALSLQNRWTLL